MSAEDKALEILDKLVALEHGRQALVDALWAQIPSYIEEYSYLASTKLVQLNPMTTQLERIESVIATIPAGATGLLQLGDRSFPLGAGVTTLTGLSVLLVESDQRSLASTVTGPVSLYLSGRIVPSFGTLR